MTASKTRRIELARGDFTNFGAEMMLRSSLDALGARVPNAKFAGYVSAPNREAAAQLGMDMLRPGLARVHRRGAKEVVSAPSDWLSPRNMNALLDIGGFSLSDQWGYRPAARMSIVAHSYRRRRRLVAYLPQSFGPFSDRWVRTLSREAIRDCVVYARDAVSERYVKALGTAKVVLRAPDITIGNSVPLVDPLADVIFVPNARNIDRGKQNSDTYIEAFANALDVTHSLGLVGALMVHTMEPADKLLAEKIAARSSGGPGVLLPPSGQAAKSLLGGSRLVVASRYHAAVGALSSGTPVVVVGWSHKYRELLTDFGLDPSAYAVSVRRGNEIPLSGIVAQALGQIDLLQSAVRDSAPALRSRVASVWDDVADLLG